MKIRGISLVVLIFIFGIYLYPEDKPMLYGTDWNMFTQREKLIYLQGVHDGMITFEKLLFHIAEDETISYQYFACPDAIVIEQIDHFFFVTQRYDYPLRYVVFIRNDLDQRYLEWKEMKKYLQGGM